MKRTVLLLLIVSLLGTMVLPIYADRAVQEFPNLPTELLEQYSITFSDSLQEESQTIHTFEEDIILRGEGPVNGRVLIWFYTEKEEGQRVLWIQEELSLGASGLYQLQVALRCLGVQQGVILFLQEGSQNLCERILYLSCCRHAARVQEDLEEYRFNIYEILGGVA